MKRSQRLFALLVTLQTNHQIVAADLADQFGVSRRTILRDIEALAAADIPVITERGRYGGITLLPGAEVDMSRLTGSEAEVLEVIGVDLPRAKQLGLEAAARSAGQKIAARRPWPRHASGSLLPLNDVVAIDNKSWFAPDEPAEIAALIRDVRRGKRLRIHYRASGRRDERERVVDPYGVFSRGGRWYLIADVEGEPRMFALARLQSWIALDEQRRVRANLSLSTVAAKLVTELEDRHSIHVTAIIDAGTEDMARRILGKRLLSVDAVAEQDSVRITVGYEHLDAVRQLLQFSDHIEVTDPPEARALVARLAASIAHRHR